MKIFCTIRISIDTLYIQIILEDSNVTINKLSISNLLKILLNSSKTIKYCSIATVFHLSSFCFFLFNILFDIIALLVSYFYSINWTIKQCLTFEATSNFSETPTLVNIRSVNLSAFRRAWKNKQRESVINLQTKIILVR